MKIRDIEEGGAAEHRFSFQAFLVDMAEDVVFRTSGSDGHVQVLVTTVAVQITPSRVVGYEEADVLMERDWFIAAST